MNHGTYEQHHIPALLDLGHRRDVTRFRIWLVPTTTLAARDHSDPSQDDHDDDGDDHVQHASTVDVLGCTSR